MLNGCAEKDPLAGEIIRPVYPGFGQKIYLVNDEVKKFVEDFKTGESKKYYQKGVDHFSGGETVSFEWDNKDEAPLYYIFLISGNCKMVNAKEFKVTDSRLDISYMNVDTKYYWQVKAVYEDREITSVIFRFSTAETPRITAVDGMSNIRDIGVVKTSDGRRMKQGMVYRSGHLVDLTEDGIKQLLQQLKIKTELDVRGGSEGSPIIQHVNYIVIKGYYYENFIQAGKNQDITNAFRVFADPDNYPVLVHCSLGRDRTGMISLVLEALCGVPEKMIYRDYELSFFSKLCTNDGNDGEFVQVMLDQFTPVINYIKSFGDKDSSLSECTEKYLLYLGLTQDEINTIRSMLLED